MDPSTEQGGPGPLPEACDDGTAEHERLAAALERGLRRRLNEEFPPGPLCARLAHIEARWRLLATSCGILAEEAAHLRAVGLEEEALRLEQGVTQARATLSQLRGQCRRLEGQLAGATDPARFAALQSTIERASAPETLRAAANECLQAIGRIGVAGVRFLWRELETAAQRRGHPLTADLVKRFETEVATAEATSLQRENRRRSRESEPTLVLLREQAQVLVTEAARMERQELLDHLESIAGRLKAIQEEAAPEGQQAALLRQTFGALTRISKDHQPGWTPLLDPNRQGEDWRAYARDADIRIAEREEARQALRRAAEQEQQREALERLREYERRVVLDESIERLRSALFNLEGVPQVPGTETMKAGLLAEARLQAEIALRAAGGPEDIERLTKFLADHRDEVCAGRVFRPLRRSWSEPAAPAGIEVLEAAENPEVQIALEGLETPWPAGIEVCRKAGQGERVLLVGGRPSPRREKLFEDFFGWSEVEWKESYRDHQADYAALRRRIAADRFDRVIVLARYCGHDVSSALSGPCRAHGVSYHVHPGGLSIASLATFIYGA